MKFSFIIPVYASLYLNELYESLYNQTYINWEAIFVDDGSPDNGKTIKTLKSIAEKDDRVILIFQENFGIGAAVNNGLTKSTGDYVMILGHDDCISHDLLDFVFETAKKHNTDIISPNVDMFFNDKSSRFIWNEKFNINLDEKISGREAFLKTFPWSIHGWNFYRGDIIRKTYFPTFTSYNADEYAYRELMLKSDYVSFCNGFYRYRFVQSSITNQISKNFFDVFITDEKLVLLSKKYNFTDLQIENIIYEYYLDLLNRIKILARNSNLHFYNEAKSMTKNGYIVFKSLKPRLRYKRFIKKSHFFLIYFCRFDCFLLIFKLKSVLKKFIQQKYRK